MYLIQYADGLMCVVPSRSWPSAAFLFFPIAFKISWVKFCKPSILIMHQQNYSYLFSDYVYKSSFCIHFPIRCFCSPFTVSSASYCGTISIISNHLFLREGIIQHLLPYRSIDVT